MASAIASERDRTEKELKLCGACTRDSQTIPAINWCRDCREGMCEPCYTYHKKHKTSTKHDIISIDAVTEKEFIASKLDIERFCKSHDNEPLKIYCESHNSFCCKLCVYSSHKECKGLIPLDDIAKLREDQKLLLEQTTAFKETTTKVQIAIDKKSTCLQNLDRDKSSILSRASDTLKKAKDKLDQLYRDFERKVIEEHEQIKQSQDKMMSILLEFQKEVECNTDTLQSLQHVTPVETLIMMETLKTNIVQHYENMADELKQDSNIHITCKLDTSMTTLLDNLSSIGEIVKESYGAESSEDVFCINKIKTGLDIGKLIGSPAQYPVLSRKDLMTTKVNLVKVIKKKDLTLNGNFEFTDGKYLDQGHLVLADFESGRLVLLNENMKIVTQIKVDDRPSCVDVSDDGKKVTVVCLEKSVQRYSLPGGHEVERRMTVQENAWGVAVTGDTTIIGHHYNKVALYDNKGKVMKSTTTGILRPYIAKSTNGQRFFYCEDEDGTVVSRDREFKEKWRYQCDNLRSPRGICVDPYDNVYVVGTDSKNVHQISGDGTRHRVLLQQMNKIVNPYAIAFNRTRDMFVVTSWEKNGPLEMYEFSH